MRKKQNPVAARTAKSRSKSRRESAADSIPADAGVTPMSASPPAGRGTRRRLETRERLLDAAFQLMAARGMEGVAINEITDLADVGFGSFYNHFESKEAIYTALVDRVFEGFADALEASTARHSDPAEIVAASIRRTIQRAAGEPTWARFLIREGLSSRTVERGLGRRLLRDIQQGIASGRFTMPDVTMAFLAVGGTVLAAITAQLEVANSDDVTLKALAALGDSHGSMDQRVSTTCLQILGLEQSEAGMISRKKIT